MAELSPSVSAPEPAAVVISHNRLLVEMAILIVIGTLLGLTFGGVRFGLGVLLGGGLAYLNYYWLKRSTAAIFEKALSGERARLLALRYIGRYIVIGLVILAVYASGLLSAAGVIAGLAAFAFAVVVDGFISIFRRNT